MTRIAIAVLVVATVSGCKETRAPETSQSDVAAHAAAKPPASSEGGSADASGSAEAADSVDAGAASGATRTCQQDFDCEKYRRCIDGTCQVPPAMTGTFDETTPMVTFTRDGKEVASFHVELAQTPAERERGLMYRRSMKPDWGMLFVYGRDGDRRFWMKNTLIPLDMVFIADDGGVVGVVEGAEPMTLTPRAVGRPARYVLELNAGVARAHDIGRGATMTVSHVQPDVKPHSD